MDLKKYVATVKDFPKEGILYRDITPLMGDGPAYKYAIDLMVEYAKARGAEIIVGPEARGFIFGCPVAAALGIGFAPIRKPGKLPREAVRANYSLEYGNNILCLHADAIKPGQKVLIVDDLLATGGTVQAGASLVERLGGEVVGIVTPIELPALGGRKALHKYDIFSLMTFDGE